MQQLPLGASGIEASVVGLGTWAIGGWCWGGTDDAAAVAAIRAGLDEGITLIDTAPAYGLGVSEELVGRAIAGRRDEVVLATKCGLVWHTDAGRRFFDEYGQTVRRYLGPESIRHEVESSLRRLETDRIDLYQTHWQDDTTSIEDTMAALLELKQQGKIRAIGVSNATPDQMDAYRRWGPLDTDQERYSMLDRQHERSNLPYCLDGAVAFLAYSPLALGLLTGTITPARRFDGDDQRAGDPRFSPDGLRRVDRLLRPVRAVADDHGATVAQTVIAWTLARPGVTHALVGARNPRQARENAGAGDLRLTADELASISAAVAAFDLEGD